jgi:hypothetical protein
MVSCHMVWSCGLAEYKTSDKVEAQPRLTSSIIYLTAIHQTAGIIMDAPRTSQIQYCGSLIVYRKQQKIPGACHEQFCELCQMNEL